MPTLLVGSVERQLFQRTVDEFERPDLISWVPTRWLLTIANPHFLDTTTKHRDGDSGDRVTIDELYTILLREGMRDPLVIAFGRSTHRYRLDEGNQRVQLFSRHGITHLPVVGVVADTHVIHPRNGMHEGLALRHEVLPRNGLVNVGDILPNIVDRTTIDL